MSGTRFPDLASTSGPAGCASEVATGGAQAYSGVRPLAQTPEFSSQRWGEGSDPVTATAASNMTLEKLAQVLARQMPDGEKCARADLIVDTGGTHADPDAQVDNIVESLEGRTGTAFATAWA